MRATQPHPLPAAEASGVSHASSDPLEEQRVTATREGGFRTAGASPRAVGSGAASPPVQPAASWDCGAGSLVVARASFVSHQAQQWFLGGPPRTGPAGQVRGRWGRGRLAELGPCSAAVPSHACIRGHLQGVPAGLGSAWNSSAVSYRTVRLSISRVQLVLELSCWWSMLSSKRFPLALTISVNGHGLPRGFYGGRLRGLSPCRLSARPPRNRSCRSPVNGPFQSSSVCSISLTAGSVSLWFFRFPPLLCQVLLSVGEGAANAVLSPPPGLVTESPPSSHLGESI